MDALDQGADLRRIPAVVRDVEISQPLPAIPAMDEQGRRVGRAWLLVRAFTEPIGFSVLDVPESGLSAEDIAAAIMAAFGPRLQERIAAAGGDISGGLSVTGVSVPATPAVLARRAEVLRSAPSIAVVIPTRERPEELARCLDSLIAQDYPSFRVVVVDSAPLTPATADVVKDVAGRSPVAVDYLSTSLPGASRARNRALLEKLPGQLIVFTDDDTVADPHWLAEIAVAFAEHPDADAVAGVIVPAELATDAQIWFEQFGGHSKGRGFVPDVFSPATAKRQSPLYPLPPFGTGANMAFRAGVLERLGGFDPALGPGSHARGGGDDTHVFMKLLYRGGTVVYQPTALIRHYHRRDVDGLRKQLVGYAIGLTAAYTSIVRSDPRAILTLLRLVPTALRDILASDSPRTATIEEDFPPGLLAANRRGLFYGPVAYLRGWRAERRLRRAGSSP
jgi:GT2 family glycosyltransferase